MGEISDQDYLNTPEWHEHAERMNAWATNPNKDKIRRAAKKVIKKRIGEIVEPLGLKPVEQGTGWEIEKGFKIRLRC